MRDDVSDESVEIILIFSDSKRRIGNPFVVIDLGLGGK